MIIGARQIRQAAAVILAQSTAAQTLVQLPMITLALFISMRDEKLAKEEYRFYLTAVF